MVSRRSIKGVSRTLIVAAVIVIVIIAGIGAYYLLVPPEEAREQTLIIGTTQAAMNLDPAIGFGYPNYFIDNFVFEALTEWKLPDTVEVEPELATEWTVSDDLMTYDFTLRQGVKFHDGTEMTAEDVEFSIERAKGLGGALVSVYLDDVDHVDVLDTYKVRIYLTKPTVLLPKIFGCGLCSCIVSEEAVIQAGDDWGKTVLVGTGPFKFVEYAEGEKMVFERFDDYWGPKAKLEEIIALVELDPTVAKMSLERGDIDVFYLDPLMQDIPALQANPDIEWQGHPTEHLRYIAFNHNFSVFQDKRVKQAIYYGINRTRVLHLGYMGEGNVATSMMNSYITPFHEPVLKESDYDPEKAKALLTEAGYPNGFQTTLLYTDHYEGAADHDAAVVIQDELAKIGVDVTLDFADWATFLTKRPASPMVLAGYFPGYLDPENALILLLHGVYGWNRMWGRWNNTRFNELGYLGKVETDLDKRIEIYDEAQEIVADELPVIPLRETSRHIFYRTWVKNLTLYPLIFADDITFANVYID